MVSFSSLLLLILYSFSSLSMPRVIFRFGGLSVLFFISPGNEMQPSWIMKLSKMVVTYFPKFSCTCVLQFWINYRISSFEQMNWWLSVFQTLLNSLGSFLGIFPVFPLLRRLIFISMILSMQTGLILQSCRGRSWLKEDWLHFVKITCKLGS